METILALQGGLNLSPITGEESRSDGESSRNRPEVGRWVTAPTELMKSSEKFHSTAPAFTDVLRSLSFIY